MTLDTDSLKSVVLTTLVITAAIAGAVSLSAHPTAAGSSEYDLFNDFFEDESADAGTPDDWTLRSDSGDGTQLNVTTVRAYEGSQSMGVNVTKSGEDQPRPAEQPYSSPRTENVSLWGYVDKTYSSDEGVQLWVRSEANTDLANVQINATGVVANTSAASGDEIVAKGMGVDEWAQVKVFDIDLESCTYDILAKNATDTVIERDQGWDDTSCGASGYDRVVVPMSGMSFVDKFRIGPRPTVDAQVVDQQGDPVADATVKTIGYDFSNLTGTIQEKRQQAQDIRDQTFDVEPDSFDKNPTLFDGGQNLQSKDTYAVAHAYSDYDAGATPTLGDRASGANPPDDPNLSPPRVTIPSDQSVVVSLWDADDGGFAQNAINEELPGSTTSGEVVIERVDAAGDPIDRTVATTRDTFAVSRTAAGLATTNHEAVTIADPAPGYYKIYPTGSPAAGYTVAVVPSGGLSELQTQIRTSLERQADAQADELAAQAQALENEQQAGNISLKSKTTDSNGQVTFAVNSSTLEEVTVIAYKGPNVSSLPQNASRQEIRDYYRNQVSSAKDANLTSVFGRSTLAEACGEATDLPAYYRPAEQVTTDTPADVTVEVSRVGMPEAVDMAAQQCRRFNALQELRNDSLGDLIPNLPGKLQNASASELETLLEKARSNAFKNSATCAEATRTIFGEVSPDCNVNSEEPPDPTGETDDGEPAITDPTGGGGGGPGYIPAPNVNVDVGAGGGLTESEVREIVSGLQEADDTVGDTAPTGEPDVTTGNETVSVGFPVDADLSNESGITLTARYTNGTERVLDQSSEYVSVDTSGVGDDVVRVSDYPLGDAAGVSFELDVATAEETASATAAATNPSFSGTIPDLGHLRLSASQPGVGDRVVVDPGAAPQAAASFGGLQSAQAFAPNGTALNTTISDGAAEFTTAAVGVHRVELTLTNPGGQEFVETVTVRAGDGTTNRPPTLRAQTGALGQYAVASDGLAAGSIETEAAGERVRADAVIPADADVPSRLHVHEQGVDAQPDHTTEIRVLKGENRQQISKRTTVILHPARLSENALIYRNGEPAVQGAGETDSLRAARENGSWSITTTTTDQGTVEIRTVNDPGFVQATIFSIQTSLPDVPIIGWAIVPGPGVAAVAVLVIGRRRRDPPGGRGGAGGSGGVTA